MIRPGDPPERTWEGPVLTTALMLGLVLMGIQLWLLTVALDLLLGGKTEGFLRLVISSGAVFAGGLLVLWVLRRQPRAQP